MWELILVNNQLDALFQCICLFHFTSLHWVARNM